MKYLKVNIAALITLALPLALTGLVQSSVWFFETIFLAHLSPEALAAGSLVSWSFGTVIVVLYGTLSSINVLIAHKYGAEDEHGIFLIVRDGFWLAIVLAIPTIILFWNMSSIFMFVGQTPAVVLLAKTYLHAMAWGILPNVIMLALLEAMMGLGRARLILIFTILSVSLTTLLSFAFIFGRFGLPELGIAGAGWGLTISNWITVLFIAGYTLTNKNFSRYFTYILKPIRPFYIIELLYIGAPMGLMYCVEVAFFLALTIIMGTFGSAVLAANQIALQYLGALMAVIFSTAQAITVRMGHLLGAGEKEAAEQSAYIGIGISVSFMLLVAGCYWLIPNQLISLDFNPSDPKNADIVHYATKFLTVCAIFQILESMRISLFGALRALKDTRFTLLISLVSFWCVALPLGYYLAFQLNLRGIGLWWGMVIGAGVSVMILFWRFKTKISRYSVEVLTS